MASKKRKATMAALNGKAETKTEEATETTATAAASEKKPARVKKDGTPAAPKNKPRGPEDEIKSAARYNFDPNKKVKVLIDHNPKREGSAAHSRFNLYGKGGDTVSTYLHRGVKAVDINWDVKHSFIELVD